MAQRVRDRVSGDLSIVIVSWNVRELLRRCLTSLQGEALGGLETEIIVVDNASSDGSVEMASSEYPLVRLLVNSTNAGFARGSNQGLRESTGRYILLLNPDTEILGDALPKMVQFMDDHPQFGIVGPRLLDFKGDLQDSRRRFPSLPNAFFESTILQQWFPQHRLLKRFYVQDRPEDSVQEVDWLVGACLLARREAVAEVGPLDEDFFMYSEEVDWCHRMKACGWGIAYFPAAQVVHLEGQSSRQELARRDINFHSSRVHFFAKHRGAIASLALRVFIITTFIYRFLEEAAKLLLGHKPELRRQRLSLIAEVIGSGLASPARRSACSRFEHVGDGTSEAILRVAFVTGEFPPLRGGVGDYTDRLTHHLADQGVDITVITSAAVSSAEVPSPDDRSVAVVREIGDWGWPSWRQIRTILRQRPADIVHVQYQTGAYGLHPAVNLLPLWLRFLNPKPKVITTFHDLRVPYIFPKIGRLRELANLALAGLSDLAIVTNEDDYRVLERRGKSELSLIPIGSNIAVDPPRGFQPATWRNQLGVAPDQTLLAYFGFLNSSKGLDVLLDALSILRRAEGAGSYRLLMVGGGVGDTDPTNKAYKEQLQQQITRLDLTDSIIWTDYANHPEISACLLSAQMGVFPFLDGASFRRGSLLAALFHGLPIISTSPPNGNIAISEESLPRLVDGLNALLVPPGQAEPLAEAIRRLSADEDLRHRLADGAEALARGFQWEGIAKETILLYRKVVQRNCK